MLGSLGETGHQCQPGCVPGGALGRLLLQHPRALDQVLLPAILSLWSGADCLDELPDLKPVCEANGARCWRQDSNAGTRLERSLWPQHGGRITAQHASASPRVSDSAA